MKNVLLALAMILVLFSVPSCSQDEEIVAPDFKESPAPTDQDDNNGGGPKGGGGSGGG